MRLIVALCIVLVVVIAPAQDWAKKKLEASNRHQEWKTLKNGSREVKCFVVYPERKDKAPVVVLIHEIMGMTEWVESVADDLAAAGYIAIAPDLLSGMGPNSGRTDSFADLQHIREAISGLPASQVVGDLNAVCEYAKTIDSANGKLAVGGFCWGGTQSFNFATARPDLSAAFVFYGTPPSAESMANIKCPVYGFYGGNDNRVTSTVPKAQDAMKAAGKTYEPVVYEGAGHGFMRTGQMPEADPANKKARDAAWAKVMAVLGKL
jgi:carboxymethylenebutenolidase